MLHNLFIFYNFLQLKLSLEPRQWHMQITFQKKKKIIIPSKNGLFVTPEGGWFKQRRTFHVVKGMLLIIIFDI